MFGLDNTIIKKMDYKIAIERIVHDINSDFILAPHYNAIFEHASEELWQLLKTQLNNGKYNPLLPITIEVPKKSGLTRPGVIFNPIDRLLYQLLIDLMVEDIEIGIDRERVYSNEYDPWSLEPGVMFVSVSSKYDELRNKLTELCNSSTYSYALVADIACYFERIYQHVLINILRSTKIEPELISILEKVLSAHTSKDSHGIAQGMYPSDILGNYYLTAFDSYLKSRDVEFIRFVDDYWMFFNNKKQATRTLTDICNYVRKEGLYLNEHKTRILSTDDLHYEETEIDALFNNAKDELKGLNINSFGYNFDPFDIDEYEEDIELKALEELYYKRYEETKLIEKIDKFCLPRFAAARSNIAINDALEGLLTHHHLTGVYIKYLRNFIEGNDTILIKLEEYFLQDKLNYDWQIMWILGLFYSSDHIPNDIVMQTYSLLEDNNKSPVIRGLCALIASKHGNGPIRRLVRNRYSSEPSSYVKEAILYSTLHFPSADDRAACIKAWEGHSEINKLIVKAMKNTSSINVV